MTTYPTRKKNIKKNRKSGKKKYEKIKKTRQKKIEDAVKGTKKAHGPKVSRNAEFGNGPGKMGRRYFPGPKWKSNVNVAFLNPLERLPEI